VAATAAQNTHADRKEWLRSKLPAAAAVDENGARFYPLAAVRMLAPHAAAVMAAERKETAGARDLAIGRTFHAALADGASPAEAAERVAILMRTDNAPLTATARLL
jgi:hypothetical protein